MSNAVNVLPPLSSVKLNTVDVRSAVSALSKQ
jgi:hypothetical protein